MCMLIELKAVCSTSGHFDASPSGTQCDFAGQAFLST